MPDTVGFSLKGQKELIKNIQKASKEIKDACIKVVDQSANIVKLDAQTRVQSDSGRTAREIKVKKARKNRFTRLVVSSAPEGVFLEFGTGMKFQMPAEIAKVRRSKASGHHKAPLSPDALKMLTEWAKRNGIQNPEKAAVGIAIAIGRRGGLTPKPFIFPALEAERSNFWNKLQAEFQKAVNASNKVTTPAATGGA